MSLADEILAGIESSGLSPASQELLKEFLNDYGNTLQAMGPEILEQILGSVLTEDKASPEWDALVANLDPTALNAMLAKIGVEMDAQVTQRQNAVTQIENLIKALETLGLQLVTRLILAAI